MPYQYMSAACILYIVPACLYTSRHHKYTRSLSVAILVVLMESAVSYQKMWIIWCFRLMVEVLLLLPFKCSMFTRLAVYLQGDHGLCLLIASGWHAQIMLKFCKCVQSNCTIQFSSLSVIVCWLLFLMCVCKTKWICLVLPWFAVSAYVRTYKWSFPNLCHFSFKLCVQCTYVRTYIPRTYMCIIICECHSQ